MTTKVYFRGSQAEAKNLVYRLMRVLTGGEPDAGGIARGVFLAVGFAALSSIKDDFITKSRGGTGADGVKWKPLTKEYLAYGRRFGPGEAAGLKKAAGLGRSHRLAPGQNKGLLTAAQKKRWGQIFASTLARLLHSLPDGEAKARAAQIAWTILKREGAKTKLEVFGNRTVDINRDTNILFNSLSPGELNGEGPSATYSKPSGDGGDQQIFQTIGNGVIVGTNVAYAAAVNKIRPIVPEEAPHPWQEEWGEVAAKAVEIAARMVFEGSIAL